ncbi:BamA/TamA family outer membrane protein [Anaerovibrio sp.]|uniref:BamA/OMP85 family outer membrane protein n=1 Tax=Anaerovibrio sp. TaxID=1872532 RepID=UPI0025D54980|nr:BamA/TamA family outer membrane protein [Anaerovibrio sp.]
MRFSSKLSKKNYRSLACALAVMTSFTMVQTASAETVADAPAVTSEAPAAPAETNEAGKAAAVTNNAPAANDNEVGGASALARSKWEAKRPSDATVTNAAQRLVGRTIMAIEFEGITDDVIKTAEASLSSKVGDKLTIDMLTKDANNIYDTGYFYDLYPSFKELPEGVVLTYHVFSTPIVKSIEIKGNTSIESTDSLLGVMQLKPGDRLNRHALQEDMAAIKKKYAKDGYVMAKVHDMGISDDGALSIEVNEGVLEGYKIKGLKKTKEKVILRELRTVVGKPLNKKDMVRSYQRITNLNYFESVDMKPIPGVEPNACILEIDITEKNTGTFGVGAGYSTSDGIIGMINVGDTNFRGVGDAVNLVFTMSGDSKDARGWSFSYRRPWLDKRETSGIIRLYNRTYVYNDYNESGSLVEEMLRKASGFEFGFTRPQSEYSSNSIYFRNKKDTYDQHKSGSVDRSTSDYAAWRNKNFGLTRSITFTHATDTRDNIMYPTSGHSVALGVEWAGLGGDFKYWKYTIDDAVYRKVGRNQILAFHTSYGHSTSDLTEFAKFRLGGQDSIRGYRDDQFRGNSMFLETIEFRFPLGSKMKGAIFTDHGAAWNNGWLPKHFHSSIGVGMMIDTPVGPIRLDLGHGSQGNRVHFNIGTSF